MADVAEGCKCRRLEGKTAIVTASTKGIGLGALPPTCGASCKRLPWELLFGVAIAQRLGEEGANVVVSSRRKDHVDKAVKLLQVPIGQLKGPCFGWLLTHSH